VPEGPEIETIRADIEAAFVGKRITDVAISGSGARLLRRGQSPHQVASRLVDRVLSSARRRGKYLLFDLDSGDVLVAHMGMSGQLIAARPGDPALVHTRAVLRFAGGRELRFVDPRTFGEMFVSQPAQPGGDVPELAHLGIDAFDPLLTRTRLAAMLSRRKARLKSLLVDQSFLAGIGNIYADEILFAARVRPDRLATDLSSSEVGRLRKAISSVLSAALAHRGSTLVDGQYVDLNGKAGNFQLLHNVYGREGKPCPRCSAPIVRSSSGGRSSHFCARCQN
jgi:formamidopyrimidine-DNA glycosylase